MSTILYNGSIYQNRNKFSSALLIENGVIIACGNDSEILTLKTKVTELIDLKGKTVLPGFNDSHLHFYTSAIALSTVSLNDQTSIQAMIEKGKQFINQTTEPQQALFGRGWNQDYFIDKRLPSRFDLDQISSSIPIVFYRVCGHIAVCNTKALEYCQINESTNPIDGGQIDKDEGGKPTGIIRENALFLLNQLKPIPSIKDMVKSLQYISQIANSYGITSVQTNDLTMGSTDSKQLEDAYHVYAQSNPSVRVHHQISFTNLKAFKDWIQSNDKHKDTTFNHYGPLKLFTDGSLGAHTALLRNPYHDDPSTNGIACLTPSELDDYVQCANQNNIQVIMHAIGDLAILQVLDSYAKVIQKGNPLRHGIVHCQITDIPLLERFKSMDILALVQPIFLHYDMHIVEKRVGSKLASTSYAFKTMEDLKLHVAYGTDSPVEELNVFENIHSAVNREDIHSPGLVFQPEQRVNLYTAIDNYTIGSAYASFEEDHKGRLEPNYLADLIVLNKDIFSLDPKQLKEVLVDMTMVNGVIVFQR